MRMTMKHPRSTCQTRSSSWWLKRRRRKWLSRMGRSHGDFPGWRRSVKEMPMRSLRMDHSLCMDATGRNRPSQRRVVSVPSTRVMRAYMSRRNLLLNRWMSKDKTFKRSCSHPLNNKIWAFNSLLFQANKRSNERNRETGCASSERRSGRKRPSSRPSWCWKGATWIAFNSTNKA